MSICENDIVLKVNSILDELDKEIEEFKKDMRNINKYNESKYFERKDKIFKVMNNVFFLRQSYQTLKYNLGKIPDNENN